LEEDALSWAADVEEVLRFRAAEEAAEAAAEEAAGPVWLAF